MNKKELSERDICSKFIGPAIKRAGWDGMMQIREEVAFTKGRIIVRGKLVTRGKAKRADYILYYKPNIPIAIIEAKDNNHSIGDGMQQALDYAVTLNIPFVFSSNGDGFVFHDRTGTSIEKEATLSLDGFPSPKELWSKYRARKGLTPDEEAIVLQDYFDDGSGKGPRYYQCNAINAAIEAIAKGQNRILLVMATGTGKTYQLIEALRAHLVSRPLSENQAVLGVTYMHSSRRRMHSRLAELAILRGHFLASTIDSLARSIVWRWRTLATDIEPQLDFSGVVDFDMVCKVAANLLRRQSVFGWFCIRYPIVLVDELQDCKSDRLCVIQAIESCCHVIAAADEYQDLQPDGSNAAVTWLHASAGKQTVLTGNRRTKQSVLLQAARQLRLSQDCGTALGNTLMSGRNTNAAAGGVARTLCWKQCKDVVILTPTTPEKSSFVRDVVERLSSKPIQPSGIAKPVGPFRVIWESNMMEEKARIISNFDGAAKGVTLQQFKTWLPVTSAL